MTGLEALADRLYYLAAFLLLGIGTYTLIGSQNLVKKVIGMNVFQTGIFLFFVTTAFVDGGRSPVGPAEAGPGEVFASPLGQEIVLTAIVVGVALTAVALALIVRIYDEYGTLDEETLREVRTDE